MITKSELSRAILIKAKELGLDLCGFAELRPLDAYKATYDNWLDKGYHAGMEYMARNRELRLDPSLLADKAKSVIICGLNYYKKYNPNNSQPVFSIYAHGEDYHKVLKDRLYSLFEYIKELIPQASGRVFVDSAPIMEKGWAVEAGLGWIGKNSMLINKHLGSFIFLGEIVLDLELEYNKSREKDYCGSCTKCIEACPNGAIQNNHTIDSGKCISYLTIEHKGTLDEYGSADLRNNVFGCDICQNVCPWNKKAKPTKVSEFHTKDEILEYSYDDWKLITEEDFNTIFRNSPVLRTGYRNFKRNLEELLSC